MVIRELLYAMCGYNRHENPKWIIWGAGQRGRLLLKYLKNLELSEIYFADNDEKKAGSMIENILCLSGNEVRQTSERSIILVSPRKDGGLYDELCSEFPYVIPNTILDILDYWPKANGFEYIMPLGHYFSLYPDMNEVAKRKEILYRNDKEIKDIDFNIETQYDLLDKMKLLLPSVPEWKKATEGIDDKYRYRIDSPTFSVSDAVCLHMILRILRPGKLIEVGSGWSSAVTLDTNEFYLNNKLELSFIEPYPTTLNSILKKADNIELKKCGLEEIDLSYFDKLDEGDILFIDSTHVSKIGSDVNYLLFEILPRLKKGVYIHFHDIFYPFEYPYEWLKEEGYIWNELYMLRAFLMNNKEYRIVFFFDYLSKMHNTKIKECLHVENVSGGSFWLEKI